MPLETPAACDDRAAKGRASARWRTHLEGARNIDALHQRFLQTGAWKRHQHVRFQLRFEKNEEVQADKKDPEEEPVTDAAADRAEYVEVLLAGECLVLMNAHYVKGFKDAVRGNDDAHNDDEDGTLQVRER